MELNLRQKRELILLGAIAFALVVLFEGIDYLQQDYFTQSGDPAIAAGETAESPSDANENSDGGMQAPFANASGNAEELISGEDSDPAVRVDDTTITVGDIRSRLRMPSSPPAGGEASRAATAASQEIFEELAMQEARARDLLPDDSTVQQRVDQQMEAAGEEVLDMKSSITGMDMTEEKLRERLTGQVTRELAIAELKQTLFPPEEISDSEIDRLKQKAERELEGAMDGREITRDMIRRFLQDRNFGRWYRGKLLPGHSVEVVHPELQEYAGLLTGREAEDSGGSGESSAEQEPSDSSSGSE